MKRNAKKVDIIIIAVILLIIAVVVIAVMFKSKEKVQPVNAPGLPRLGFYGFSSHDGEPPPIM